MAQPPVQPLKVNKNASSSAQMMDSRGALSDISPMGIRRNSPSFTVHNLGTSQKSTASKDSPYMIEQRKEDAPVRYQREELSSPLGRVRGDNSDLSSPIAYTKSRRSSLERLQKASRVRNSNIFLKNSASTIEISTASKDGNSSPKKFPFSAQQHTRPQVHSKTAKEIEMDVFGATKENHAAKSLSKAHFQNNSVVRFGNFVPSEGTWSDDEDLEPSVVSDKTPRGNFRYTKTVSFDAAPPQVNEYEMVTPDLSSIASDSRESSYDPENPEERLREDRSPHFEENYDSFDESLEDVFKTPVVAPDEWRCSGPTEGGDSYIEADADAVSYRIRGAESSIETEDGAPEEESISSSDETVRPLPPLPVSDTKLSSSQAGLCNSTARAASLPQTPSSRYKPPRPASVSKAEILGMREIPMPLGERLRLLELQDQQRNFPGQQSREKYIGRPLTGSQDTSDHVGHYSNIKASQNPREDTLPKLDTLIPPKISRESILRNIKPESKLYQELGPDFAPHGHTNLDPDIPVPSSEVTFDSAMDSTDPPVKIEDDYEDPPLSVHSYPGNTNSISRSSSNQDEMFRESSVIHHNDPYQIRSSASLVENESQFHSSANLHISDEVHTEVLAQVPNLPEDDKRMSLPEFGSFLDEDDFGISLMSYMTPSPCETNQLSNFNTGILQQNLSLPTEVEGSPESDSDNKDERNNLAVNYEFSTLNSQGESGVASLGPQDQNDVQGELIVPENKATIKAPGTRLKTRPSLCPGEILTTVNAREEADIDSLHSVRGGLDREIPSHTRDNSGCHSSLKGENSQLAVPLNLKEAEISLKLEEEFDRLIDAKHKGYLTRQNTKLVVASNREVSGEQGPSSPTSFNSGQSTDATLDKKHEKAQESTVSDSSSTPLSQTWTTEPWNGRMRRQSTRRSIFTADKRLAHGPVPPVPGYQSNSITSLEEIEEGAPSTVVDEEEERGRLFVKVIGVKNLDLPLPEENNWFQLTLDNGLHCVTTAWLELGRAAPVGQEFELTVFADLDFQLTLHTKVERPISQASTSSVDPLPKEAKVQKHSAFSRFLSSPKKKRELEKKKKAEGQAAATQKRHQVNDCGVNNNHSAWDLLHGLIGPDGSFARSYISLKDYESLAFGRPFSTSVPCYNEWAIEGHAANGSTHSKLGGIQRKPPYPIGILDLQLLFVPKPRGAKDEDMPQSMSACIKQLKLAEEESLQPTAWEGFLSQQGGDCPYWRRRFFRLDGKSLISYHETTRQRRANINLSKATKLIDDRSTLTQSNVNTSKEARRRRKSAFAEEEEGYMFVEEGFRIRFSNGEIIDFYADNAKDKSNWMKILSEVIRKEPTSEQITWTKLVLARERSEVHGARQGTLAQGMMPEMEVAVAGKARPRSMVQASTETESRLESAQGSAGVLGNRKAVKSMVF